LGDSGLSSAPIDTSLSVLLLVNVPQRKIRYNPISLGRRNVYALAHERMGEGIGHLSVNALLSTLLAAETPEK